MKLRLLLALGAALLPLPALAQGPGPSRETIAAPAQPGAIALPTAIPGPDREVWHLDNGQVAVRNVTRPTLTPVLPVGRPNGIAMIVAPGGGFLGLAIEKEGWDVARWLANQGITAFVLKYRVMPTPTSQPEFADKLARAIKGEKVGFGPPEDTTPEALADGIAAVRYVRAHAADYGLNPKSIGMMGFSAGGFLTLSTALALPDGERPDFIAPIYPNMVARPVPADAPPLFVAIANDDFLLARGGLGLIDSWRQAKRPVEFHLFESGDHGFGLGKAGTPTEDWPALLLRWIRLNTPAR